MPMFYLITQRVAYPNLVRSTNKQWWAKYYIITLLLSYMYCTRYF
jgi:hypothetical protein